MLILNAHSFTCVDTPIKLKIQSKVAFDAQSQARSLHWEERLEGCLNSSRRPQPGAPQGGERYVHVMSQHLGGIAIVVFVKQKVRLKSV